MKNQSQSTNWKKIPLKMFPSATKIQRNLCSQIGIIVQEQLLLKKKRSSRSDLESSKHFNKDEKINFETVSMQDRNSKEFKSISSHQNFSTTSVTREDRFSESNSRSLKQFSDQSNSKNSSQFSDQSNSRSSKQFNEQEEKNKVPSLI